MKTSNDLYKSNYINSISIDKKNTITSLIDNNNILRGKIVFKDKDSTKIEVQNKIVSLNENVLGEINDTVSLEVISKSRKNIILKQLNTQKMNNESAKQQKISNVKELFKKSGVIEEENIFKPKAFIDEDKLKERQMLSKLKRNLSYAKNNLNENIVNQMVANGINLNKIDLSMIQTVITEASRNQEIVVDEATVNSKIDQYKKQNNIINVSEKQNHIMKKLAENNIPITGKNINGANSVLSIYNDLTNMDENSILNILKDDKPLTIENLYIFSFISKNAETSTENIDPEIVNQIKDYLKNNQIELSDENINICKVFINNEIPINKNNIDKYNFLLNITISEEEILNVVSQNIREDKNIFEMDLFDIAYKKQLTDNNKNIAASIANVTDNNVSFLIDSEIDLTVNNMLNNVVNSISKDGLTIEKQMDLLNARKIMTDISLKMTWEACHRLAESNITVETLHIKQLLDELNNIDNEKFISSFRINDADNGDLEIEQMIDLVNKVSSFANINHQVYKNILFKEMPFDIENISNRNNALNEYENHETKVNKSLGDSFNKIASQIPEFLEALGIPDTKANRRIFEILSKNNIEVTKENMIATSSIDSKIEKIYDQLHPNIIGRMIKEGVNPLNLHIDNVIDYINKYNDVFGKSPIDKLENYVLNFDNQKNIDTDTRKSVISVYKMMNQIKQNNTVGIGNAIKNNQDLTLSNLFESAKSHKKSQGINETIDDNTGITQTIENSNIKMILEEEALKYENNITLREKSIIDSVLEKNNFGKTVFNMETINTLDINESVGENINLATKTDMEVDKLIDSLSPEILSNVKKDYINDLDVSEFYDRVEILKSYANLDDVRDRLMKQGTNVEAEYLQNIHEKDIEWFVENNIQTTIKNINTVHKLRNEPNAIGDSIKSLEKDNLIKNTLDQDALSNLYKNLDMSVGDDISKTKELQHMLKLQNKINNKQNNNSYKVPVKINDKVSDLNVHLINEDFHYKNEVVVLMNIKTEHLNDVKVTLTVNNNFVDVKFDCDDKEALKLLENEGNLKFLKDFKND